jgi:rare lipoprotein A
MNKLLKSISISLAGAIVMMLFIGCTPGKAQTRGNDYKGSFQSEEFEAFDSDNSSDDDAIPAMNKTKSADSGNKYAGNSKNNSNPRVKSEAGYNEVKGKYSDRDDYSDETESGINSRNRDYEDETDSDEAIAEKFDQKGLASWYGREFHGKTTASGEKFDMNDMTAAHKTLPFGTIVEVKNLDNGRAVRLKINDRGPYRGNRIIDLSFGGAKEIGMVKTGEANVGIKVLKMGNSGKTASAKPTGKYVEPVSDDEAYVNVRSDRESEYSSGLKLQAGAFYTRKNAENLKSKIENITDRPVKIIQDNEFFKVRVEGLRDRKDANKVKSILSDESISSFVVE